MSSPSTATGDARAGAFERVKNALYKRAFPYDASLTRRLAARTPYSAARSGCGLGRLIAGYQLTSEQARMISDSAVDPRTKSMLVFGVGRDTPWWIELMSTHNPAADLHFVEASPAWAKRVLKIVPDASVSVVQFNTRRADWRELIDDESALALALPDRVRMHHWDVVIVDAPEGHSEDCPGRMSSIYEASRLVSPQGGIVWVHDAQREVERAYSARFLGDTREFAAAAGAYGDLRGFVRCGGES